MGDQGQSDRAAWQGEMFRLLAENVVDYAVFIVDPHRHVLSWSKGAERLLGFTEAEILGRQCDCFFTPEDVAAGVPQKELEQALATGRGDDDRWHQRKDGTRFWASGAVTPLKDEGGRLRGFAKIMRDRTELKRAQDELAVSRRRLQALFDNTLDAVLLADDGGRYVDANPAACSLLGYDRHELLRLGVSDITPPPDADAGRAAWVAFLRDGRQEGEYSIRRKDGTSAVVEFRAVANVQPGLHLSVLRDATERRRVRAALERSEARLAAVFEALPVGVGVTDAAGALVLSNREMFRYLPTGVMPSRDDDRHPRWVARWPDGRPVERSDFPGARALRGERVVPGVEMRYTHDDGAEVWAQVAAVPIRDGEGRVAGQVAVVTDIDAPKRAEQALRASEARLANAQRIAGVGSWEVDWPTQRVWWSAETYRLLGFEPGTFEPSVEGFLALVPAEDRPVVQRAMEAALAGEAAYRVDHRVVQADGAVRWVSEQAEVEFGPGEEPVRVAGTLLDITERVRAGEALRESEERLRTALAAARMVVWEWTPADGRLRVSENAADVFGLPAGVGLTGIDQGLALVHPDDVAAYRATYQRAIDDRAGYLTHYRLVRPDDGRVIWIEERGNTVFDQPGGAVRLFGVAADVTARREAEEVAENSRRMLHALVERCPFGIYVVDADFRLASVNAGTAAGAFANVRPLHGRPFDEVMRAIWPEPLATDLIRTFRHTLATGEPYYSKDFASPRADIDRTEAYEWELHRITLPDGRDGVVCYYFDATRLRQVEQELKDADRRKDDFLATLAHELRNPLAPIRNGLQVLRLARGDAAAADRSLGMMDRQLAQMVRLIDDLLDVSRITRGKLHLRRERVELAAVVLAAVEGSRPQIDAARHHLSVALPPAPVSLDADPARLAQVLGNLLTNAAKYTERGGDIRLSARREDGEVVVSVQDTGIGIAPEHLPRLFEMFSQVDSALERSQGGLGIGLALVRGLVEMHGGTVEARSEGRGRGSEFIVRLPVAVDTAAQVSEVSADGDASAARPRRRILVADDNRDAADSLAEMLRLGGHEVHTAYDGRAAVEAGGRVRLDVAILDIGMPGLTGYDAARHIRSEPWGRSMVLVAVTGWGQEEDKRRASEAGFDRHLTKPVDPAALEKLLATLPAGPGGRGATT